ncbi:MAG: hypothetical protein P1S59_06570 [bacterium]|nr:hypothetical protein [bacterium]
MNLWTVIHANAVVIPTVLLFLLGVFLCCRSTAVHIGNGSPAALGYLYLISLAFWLVSPFFPFRRYSDPFQGPALTAAFLIAGVLYLVVFRFRLALSWKDASLSLVLFALAHTSMAAVNFALLKPYGFREGRAVRVTELVSLLQVKNYMDWAWREAGVAFLLFLFLFRLFSTREEAGELMASPLWHFTAWFAALMLWNLLWVYEVFFTLPLFLERYFLVWFLQIFLITVVCVPFFRMVNKVPLSVAGRMAWAFLMANLGGLGFRLLILFGSTIH